MEPKDQNIKKVFKLLISIIIIIAAVGAGFIISRTVDSKGPVTVEQKENEIWTCSMHPQIRQPQPGQCPICGMDLIPVGTDSGQVPLGPREISFSPESVALMEIETSPVHRKFVEAQVRMVGKIDYDETRIKHVAAWAPGRVDKLFVDFTGTEVIQGDHMVRLYSPELISAQAEYLQAVQTVENMPENVSELIKKSNLATLKATKEKLLLLGLTEKQLSEIKEKGQPADYLTIYAPVGGIVLQKHISEGAYVQTGTMIYTIADLSQVWIKLDVYESDVNMIAYQQEVEFTTEAYPGEVFKGKITFIPPTLNEKTRTVKVRVDVPNPAGKLKPNMFVRAVVHSKLAQDGIITDPNLASKYICPMHPSIIKDHPGSCDICGMDLVTAESRGFAQKEKKDIIAPLVIPATAPLITGKRAVVYVQLPDTEKPTFQGREIVLGQRAGDYYIVKNGLTEGEIVVTNGNFKIDSELQIQAKPSMMEPQGGFTPTHQHDNQQMQNIPEPMVGHDHQSMETSEQQTLCPVMGGAINKKYFTEYKGRKIYFCCPGCEQEFLKDPQMYIEKLK